VPGEAGPAIGENMGVVELLGREIGKSARAEGEDAVRKNRQELGV